MAPYVVDPKMPFLRRRQARFAGRAVLFALAAAACWWLSRKTWPPFVDLGTAGFLAAVVSAVTAWRVQAQVARIRDAAFVWTGDELRATAPGRTATLPRSEITAVIDGMGFVVGSSRPKGFIHVPADLVGRDDLRASILATGVPARPARAETLAFARNMSVLVLGLVMLVLSQTPEGRVASAVTMVVALVSNLMNGRRGRQNAPPVDPAGSRA
jgi:hypothetical protein